MYDIIMNVISISPTTFSHSTTVIQVLKLSEYAQFVAGHGRQHNGLLGRSAIGEQKRPSMSAICQHYQYHGDEHYVQPPVFGNSDASRNGAKQRPRRGDVVLFDILIGPAVFVRAEGQGRCFEAKFNSGPVQRAGCPLRDSADRCVRSQEDRSHLDLVRQ